MLEESKSRNMVPRWRSSRKTAATNEANFGIAKHKNDYQSELAVIEAEFSLTPTVPIASELMFLASEAKNAALAQRAANFIIGASSSIKFKSILKLAYNSAKSPATNELNNSSEGTDFLREARQLLSLEYRNPVLLVDIARELTSKGHHRSALRYIRSAIALAPESRFIVRSVARYFLHIGDHEQAHTMLRRSPNIKTDPWLQATELAIATIRNKPSLLTKSTFRSLTAAKYLGPEFTELASAVATVEFNSGSNKIAKDLFKKALVNPNDNSLAQAEWAAEKLKLIVDERALQTPLSFEANSKNAYRRLEITQAITHAKKWALDEPFASRPHDALNYLYSLEDDFENALRSAETAIRVSGNDKISLHLNRLYAQIQLGNIDESYSELLRLSNHKDAKSHAIHLIADYGALAYATNDIVQGRLFYERAVELARKRRDNHAESQALAFFAHSAVAHGDPKAIDILDRANKQVEKVPSHGATYVVSRLVSEEKRKVLIAAAQSRIQQRKWTWDAASNTLNMFE